MIVPSPNIFNRFEDNNGKPLAGGLLFTYKAGTNDLLETYKDADGTALNTNPIVLDDRGYCRIFIKAVDPEEQDDVNQETGYRFELFDKNFNRVRTENNIMSLKGQDGKPGGIKGDKGDTGETGDKGSTGPRGYTGEKGDKGERGDNGSIEIFYRTAGTYPFVVPAGVIKITVILIGGGGGYYIEQTLPTVKNVSSGTAGQMLKFDLAVSQGDVITITVGKGGKATINQLEAGGGQTSLESPLITKVTANGGTAGSTINTVVGQSYFEKMSPYYSESTFSGDVVEVLPRAVIGQSSEFGQGGNVYTIGVNATGNGSSGGSGEPVLNNGQLQIATFGNGTDGLCSISYIVEE